MPSDLASETRSCRLWRWRRAAGWLAPHPGGTRRRDRRAGARRRSDQRRRIRYPFVIGEYGAGKTFFLNLIRLIALERKLVTIHADLAPDRRIYATGGQARGLLRGGGAQHGHAHQAGRRRARQRGRALHHRCGQGGRAERRSGGAGHRPQARAAARRGRRLRLCVVLKAYWRGSEASDEGFEAAALRWIRGEFSTRTEARQTLGRAHPSSTTTASTTRSSCLLPSCGWPATAACSSCSTNSSTSTSCRARRHAIKL